MFKITNKTGYMLLLPNGRYLKNEEDVDFEEVKEIPDVEDITICGFREERDVFVYLLEYYRDSFGDIVSEFRLNYYLI
jgi:hypothetical protein